MDRLPRPFVARGVCVGLFLAVAGCRATRTEVPPGRPYANDGQQRKAIEFSSEGHPMSGAATTNLMPNNLGGSNLASGIGSSGGRPDGAALGGPPGAYGPPGTAGMGQPGTGDASTTRASGGSLGTAPADLPPLGSPPGPDLNIPQTRQVAPMDSQTIAPSNDNPGTMGSPSAPPSPM
jgi:hypothetical protein